MGGENRENPEFFKDTEFSQKKHEFFFLENPDFFFDSDFFLFVNKKNACYSSTIPLGKWQNAHSDLFLLAVCQAPKTSVCF